MSERVVERTARWVERVVIGLNLCPFAKAAVVKGQVRYVVSAAETRAALLDDLKRELLSLSAEAPDAVDTTLLIHPGVLREFFEYSDFLRQADALVAKLDLDGTLQLASFHPDYCFGDSATDDPANYSNRSPYPMLHLLREASITRAVETFPDPASIPERNIETLRSLQAEQLQQLLGDDG